MTQPPADRPHMPGYGIRPAQDGTGLLPWAWAVERLAGSHDYWLATAWPDGRPHLHPVWGVWLDGALWVSASTRARKVENLRRDARCSIATDDADEPVIVEGRAEIVVDRRRLEAFRAAYAAKYGVDYGPDFVAPERNATIAIRPDRVFGLTQADFTGSPTRWTMSEADPEEP